MPLAQIDEQLVAQIRKLADGQTYQERGLALYTIECLQKKSELARSFVKRIAITDGSDGFYLASKLARQVLANVNELVAEPESSPAAETPQPAPMTPSRIVAAVASTPPPKGKQPARKLL